MFVFLSKLLPLFVYPVALVCILMAVALLLSRRPARQRWLLAAALVILLLGGNRWVAAGLVRSLEMQALPPDPLPKVDAIVLLGGGMERSGYPRLVPEVNGAGDRVIGAAWLYQQGAAPVILVSEGVIEWSTIGGNPAQDTADLLQLLGVPAQAIWLEDQSQNTLNNAQFSARILKEKGINRILLVTSAWHMPRSLRLFQAQGLQVIPFPVDYSLNQEEWDAMFHPNLATFILNLFPTAGNLEMTTKALKEYLGILVYNVRGWK